MQNSSSKFSNFLIWACHILYTGIFTLLLPIMLLRLYLRGLKATGYGQRIPERLGFFDERNVRNGGIWLHAVSVGEVIAAIPVIKALQKRSKTPITVTTMTPTGSAMVKARLGESVGHVYVPYDLPFCIALFLRKVNPSQVIIMETEIWPNLLNILYKLAIPTYIINARLSEKSFKRYKLIKPLISSILAKVTHNGAQSELDYSRFIALGVMPSKISTTGNLKFEVRLDAKQIDLGKAFKANQLSNRKVLIAASTHPEEEEKILQAFKILKTKINNAFLVLVPRHPERFKAVEYLLALSKYNYIKQSYNPQSIEIKHDILLGDTMGDMAYYYSLADLAFVGGSLVPIGGHNLLEPAACGLPSLTGPYISNFIEITDKLLSAHATTLVHNVQEFADKAMQYLLDHKLSERDGANGKNVVTANVGALHSTMQMLQDF